MNGLNGYIPGIPFNMVNKWDLGGGGRKWHTLYDLQLTLVIDILGLRGWVWLCVCGHQDFYWFAYWTLKRHSRGWGFGDTQNAECILHFVLWPHRCSKIIFVTLFNVSCVFSPVRLYWKLWKRQKLPIGSNSRIYALKVQRIFDAYLFSECYVLG